MRMVLLSVKNEADMYRRPISDQAQSAAQATRAKGASRGKVEEAFPNETTPSKRPPFEPRGKSTNGKSYSHLWSYNIQP